MHPTQLDGLEVDWKSRGGSAAAALPLPLPLPLTLGVLALELAAEEEAVLLPGPRTRCT
jgi:hypothetical protein